MTFTEQLARCQVLPVVTPIDVESTVELARVLSRAGMPGIEITLRTEAAFDSLCAVKDALPHLLLGVGTVFGPAEVKVAVDAGADFCVSPGISAALIEACAEHNMPLLPGVATASEVMLGMAHGLEVFKLFPAVAVGGIDLLSSWRGPFTGVYFCPTGGLSAENFRDFLSLPNVICCGGSWMVADSLVRGGEWEEIEAMAREAMRPTGA